MSRYIVTGAAGFIAARVVEMLLEAGHTVVGVDNLNNAYDVRLKEWRLGGYKNSLDSSLCGKISRQEDHSDAQGACQGLCRGHQSGCPGGSTHQVSAIHGSIIRRMLMAH